MRIAVAVLARTPHSVAGAYFYDVRVSAAGVAYVFRVVTNEHGVFAPATGWPALPPVASASQVRAAVQKFLRERYGCAPGGPRLESVAPPSSVATAALATTPGPLVDDPD